MLRNTKHVWCERDGEWNVYEVALEQQIDETLFYRLLETTLDEPVLRNLQEWQAMAVCAILNATQLVDEV